ncbi:PepSY-associated TM helix domain-containing protein [Acetobacter oeni]|uniref:Sulfite reductase n=1 Tax=Acetobacter oeni TaxID=304077 RepID=A0A511XNG2_9PROT|nr:PepSY domain-containing protein [Acetobacter oeni]MBB3884356.1 putative iron-regulated membrane protein [Acetobacter oeni]GBR05303.1 putative iron-regulated membrane protein [Acetobacter oeni LMG 21952]GEN64465.1 sulfite reductase [Acetobacter oeni]
MNNRFSGLWPDRRTVWRWHFFAGLFCLPFVALLSLTGSIYLFKPQIDNLIDRNYDHLPLVTSSSPVRDVDAALTHVPGSTFLAYELPQTPQSAARILVSRPDGEAIRVYVDRNSHAILKTVAEEQRFERLVFKLHGQLLLGNFGSVIMEMVASWTIVLVVTGLWLWWPRDRRGLAGVLYPRFGLTGRARWRDLHAVTGVWVSLILTLFLISGLPWSYVWGHALQSVENTAGHLTSVKDWEIGAVPARETIAGHRMPSPSNVMNGNSMDMPGMDMADDPSPSSDQINLTGLDRVVRTAATLSLPAPVLITPPGKYHHWTVRSDTQNRPLRESVEVAADGHVVSRTGFAEKGVVDRLIGYGVAAHEGHLFGWANQILNLLVALGLLLMSCAATFLWVRRKPEGLPGAPPPLSSQRAGLVGVGVLALLAILLPELGLSLLLLAAAGQLFRKKTG